jgi:hypothetical protein
MGTDETVKAWEHDGWTYWREGLPGFRTTISNVESYVYGTLVIHICGYATGSLCLHGTYTARNRVIFGIHEECDTDVDSFGGGNKTPFHEHALLSEFVYAHPLRLSVQQLCLSQNVYQTRSHTNVRVTYVQGGVRVVLGTRWP